MTTQPEDVLKEAADALAGASSPQQIEDIRIRYLGRKGAVAQLMRSIPQVSPEDRPAFGQAVNRVKNQIAALVDDAQKSAEQGAGATGPVFDPTLPGRRPARGHVHPLVQTTDEICEIFQSLGFRIAEGPEVERDYYNFEALNVPPDHPARDDADTYYVAGSHEMLLRTQTSTVQIRVMERQKPPVRVVAPGRCFRPDTEDARHSAMFHQVEGLLVDEGISFADLKAILHMFAQEFFHEGVEVRLRPSFFPFTEPSAEVDCTCPNCHGSGCGTCSYSGWLEILGAGMVDPNVFDAVGYDSEKYTGFAFGMGVERLAMLKYGIGDIRNFYQGDVRFLRQF